MISLYANGPWSKPCDRRSVRASSGTVMRPTLSARAGMDHRLHHRRHDALALSEAAHASRWRDSVRTTARNEMWVRRGLAIGNNQGSIRCSRIQANVEGQLAIIDQLRAGATSDTHRVRLTVTEAELARLAGVINAQDRQDRMAAHRHYTRALELATSIGHHPVAAYAVGGMSFLEVYGGDPRAALRLASRAAGHADQARIPGLRSWVALVSAHAHAALGHSTETTKHLGEAKDHYGKKRTAHEPAWLGFLTEQFIASDEGACLVKLGRGRQAATILDQALVRLPASAFKLRSVMLANRAAALRSTGDLDEAYRTAGEALAIAAQIDYIRVAQRVRELHANLDPKSQAEPAARELHERLALLAPSSWH